MQQFIFLSDWVSLCLQQEMAISLLKFSTTIGVGQRFFPISLIFQENNVVKKVEAQKVWL